VTSDGHGRVQALFKEALRRDPEERERFLDRACADDADLRARAQMLLDAHRTGFESGSVQRATPGLSAGQRVGPYIIRQEIGRGGMGVVYLADDTRLSRRLALKTLPSDLSRDPVRRERLTVEARAAARLTHPGIATVYALEEWDGELYLAVEYVPGTTLRGMLESGPRAIDEVAEIAVQVAQALAAAHEQGVVHRDLKPENVMRTPAGLVKVLDFGLARVEGITSPHPTQTGTIVGTPGYMSPEQLEGRAVDFRSDLFSLGVLLYEMVSGANPFESDSVTTTMARILTTDPPPLSEATPVTPPMLDRVVRRCLAKDPAQRYQSTQVLVADLEQLRSAVTTATGSSPAQPAPARVSTTVSTARWWWQFHHVVASALFVGMIYPAWRLRPLLDPRFGLPFLLAIVASAAAASSLRLNLLFIAKHYPGELTAHRMRAAPWINACDVVFVVALLCAAFAMGGRRPELSAVLVGIGVAVAIAAFIIEPTTTRAAFRARSSAVRAPAKPRGKGSR